jgi:hypothetical protein
LFIDCYDAIDSDIEINCTIIMKKPCVMVSRNYFSMKYGMGFTWMIIYLIFIYISLNIILSSTISRFGFGGTN